MTTTAYRTTAAYVSGAICGSIWWPAGQMCGKPYQRNLRSYAGLDGDGESFRDCLLRFLTQDGGDFQNAEFSADTEIRIERRRTIGPGKYSVRVKTIMVSDVAADLVNADAYTVDFMGDCE